MRGISTTILCLGFVLFAVNFSAAQENEQITCTGKIVDEQGKPLAGVEVTLYEMTYDDIVLTFDCNMIELVNTEANGAFSFSMDHRGDTYRYGYIVARREGLAVGPASWDMRKDMELEIKLDQAKELAGVVVDEKDKPVSGAKVSISFLVIGQMDDERGIAGPVSMELFSVETDAEGRFEFAGIPAAATAEFIAEKSGRATISTYKRIMYSSQKLQFTSGQKDIKLVMPVEAKIEGLVEEKSTGKPVNGIRVLVNNDNDIAYLRRKPLISKVDGTFGIDALAPGRYTIQLVQSRNTLADWVAQPVEVIIEAGKTKDDVRIEVCKGGILEVEVKDAISKQPIEQASIGVRHEQTNQYKNCRSDEKGIARIRLLPGNYMLNSVYKEGYARQTQQETFTIEEGKTEHHEFVLVEQPKITGIVRDENGKPLTGTEIRVCPSGGRVDIVSDANGTFEVTYDLSSWPGGETPTMFLVGRNEEYNLASAVEINEETRDIDLTLKPGVIFTGKIVDPNGKGISNAEVRVMLRGPRWGSTISRKAAYMDEQGNFTIKALPADHKYSLYVTSDGYGQNRSGEEIDAAEVVENRLDVGTITLPVANMSVSGMVVDVNDNPVHGVRISCYGDGQPNRETQTDLEGKFILESVCAGRIRINAYVMGSMSARRSGYIETDGGATGVKIVISDRPTSTRYVPSRPPSLVRRPLPNINNLGVEISPDEIENKKILVCFFDMNQRPSRHCVNQIIQQAEELKQKDVAVIVVQISKVEKESLENWAKENNIPFPVGMVQTEEEKARFTWGVRALPWLILADKEHIVQSEGFTIGELDEMLKNME